MRARVFHDVSSSPWWWKHPVTRVGLLAVFGTLAACAAGATVAFTTGAPQYDEVVSSDLMRIHDDILDYRADTGVWPEALVDVYGGVPTDPWGHPYVYAPVAGGRIMPDVASLGADGWPGGGAAATDRWMSQEVGLFGLPMWGATSS